MRGKQNVSDGIKWFRVSVVAGLIVVITLVGILIWARYDVGSGLEISLPERPEARGMLYIGDGVAQPGFFPFNQDDTIGSLLEAAGGTTNASDTGHLKLVVPVTGPTGAIQKVDINRAEKWLLEALPGIGPTLAQRIIDYRKLQGPFRNTEEITRVSGIGKSTYERMRDLITVGEY
jgi:competence protein ComEA